MEEIYNFMKKCGLYYLATTDGDRPRVRPFGTVDLFEGRLYIQTGKSKDVSRQIAENPKIEICCFDGKKWLRIAAEAVNDERVEAKRHMLDQYPDLKSMYDAEDENTQVLWLKNGTAVFSSFTEAPVSITF